MRDIKYRGKRIDNGEWVYGGIDIQVGDNCIFDHSCMLHSSCEVDIETVGEYTGLKDKNGKEIYEGDILQDSEDVVRVTFCEGKFIAEYRTIGGEWRPYGSLAKYFYQLKGIVIGNAFDNPDLIS